jgi:hypothetical protein
VTNNKWQYALFGSILVASMHAAACGSNSGGSGFDGGAGDGASSDGDDAGDDQSLGDEHGFGDDSSMGGMLAVQPANPVLTEAMPGPAATQQFQALSGGSPVTANWSVDQPGLGVISGQGLFTASGTSGGVANVIATSNGAQGQTSITVKLKVTGNTGNVDPNTQKQLQTGGNGDSAFRWLYPYDATVFPRGLLPPVLQFDGTAPTAMYIHVSGLYVDYQDYFAGSTPGQIPMPAAAWTQIAESAQPGEKLKVQVTKVSGGQAAGPITESWTFASGNLEGTVYYNSYDSQIANGGGVLRIKPGALQPDALFSGCTANCHAVAADGSVLVGSHGDYASGASYDLKNNAATLYNASDARYSFDGVYPDGTFMISCSSVPGPVPGMYDTRASALYDTKTGASIPAPGLDGVVPHALMPMFSPDGKFVAFNNYDQQSGMSLSMMNFAVKTHTFSALKQIASDASHYLGWPAFTPDSKFVVYHADSSPDFVTWSGNTADIFAVDVTGNNTPVQLDALDGIANGQVYLPYGAGDAHMNYEPTILPVASGGYFWIVFTSRREYGNTITDADPWEGGPARRKKLWMAAMDINPKAGADPTHPAFYLPGQEVEAGNSRGFWVLDPCHQNGTQCDSGDQCCSGFCRQTNGADGGATYTCVPPPNTCSHQYEACTKAADCCATNPPMLCINGHCAVPTPQ